MNNTKKRPAVASVDAADEVGSATPQRSQLRKRYDVGNISSSETETENENPHSRPTIPTPPPRLALGAIPRRLVDDSEMRALPLDHRAAFVLMHIDGKTPVRTLVDVTGMMSDELVTLIERLLELKAVSIL